MRRERRGGGPFVRFCTVIVLCSVFSLHVAALDLNSSHELRYHGMDDLLFEVNLDGTTSVYNTLQLQNNDLQNPDEITGFFDTTGCDSGEAVNQIYANGSYACVDLDDEIPTPGLSDVLTVNNTANQSIDMGGHDIVSIGQVGVGVDNPQAALDIAGDAHIGGHLNMSGGNITDCAYINDVHCDTLGPTTQSQVQSTGTQEEWNQGTHNGTTVDRPNDLGILGIGYENGTAGDDLIGYWRLDGTGDAVPDYSGAGNNGTVGNPGQGVSGVFGTNAFEFNDEDDHYVDLGTNPNPSGEEMAIAAWIYPTSQSAFDSHARVISKATSGSTGDHWYMLSLHDDGETSQSLRFRVQTDGSVDNKIAEDTLELNEWQHVAATYNSTHVNMYVNGERVFTDTETGTISVDDTVDTAIGRQPPTASGGTSKWDGKLDEIKVYNRSLSDDEVENLYFYGQDGVFQGEYERSISNEDIADWQTIEVDVSTIPDDTEVTAVFETLDDDGEVEEQQVIALDEGKENYTLSVDDTEDAQWWINGTSTNETETWDVSDVQVYYETVDTASTLEGVLEAGNSAGPHNIDMNHQDILNIGQLTGSDGEVEITDDVDISGDATVDGDLDMKDGKVENTEAVASEGRLCLGNRC